MENVRSSSMDYLNSLTSFVSRPSDDAVHDAFVNGYREIIELYKNNGLKFNNNNYVLPAEESIQRAGRTTYGISQGSAEILGDLIDNIDIASSDPAVVGILERFRTNINQFGDGYSSVYYTSTDQIAHVTRALDNAINLNIGLRESINPYFDEDSVLNSFMDLNLQSTYRTPMSQMAEWFSVENFASVSGSLDRLMRVDLLSTSSNAIERIVALNDIYQAAGVQYRERFSTETKQEEGRSIFAWRIQGQENDVILSGQIEFANPTVDMEDVRTLPLNNDEQLFDANVVEENAILEKINALSWNAEKNECEGVKGSNKDRLFHDKVDGELKNKITQDDQYLKEYVKFKLKCSAYINNLSSTLNSRLGETVGMNVEHGGDTYNRYNQGFFEALRIIRNSLTNNLMDKFSTQLNIESKNILMLFNPDLIGWISAHCADILSVHEKQILKIRTRWLFMC